MSVKNEISFAILFFIVVFGYGTILFAENVMIDPDMAKATKQYMDLYAGNEMTGSFLTESGGLNIANIIAYIVFGGIGFIAFTYGRKMSSWKPLVGGIVLMVYPYFVTNTFLLYGIGLILSLSLYFFRD